MQEVSITELKDIVRRVRLLAVKEHKYLPMMVWGAPGVGKSAAIKQVADEEGIGFIDLRLSLLNPVDLRGIPTADKDRHKAIWLESDFLPNGRHSKEGILFLDEINLAPQSVMSAGYQLILDRALGEYVLPEGWVIIAAGNRSEDGAAITRFPSPLANRFIHISMKNPDIDEWRLWAIKNRVHEHITTFLSRMPQHLYVFPKNQDKSFPSPRTWVYASYLYSIGQDIDAAVGKGVASEFSAFLSVYKEMPDVVQILAGKEKAIPAKTDVLWATVISLVYRAKPEHVDVLFDYISQDKFPREFQALTLTMYARSNQQNVIAISKSNKFSEWRKKPENQYIFS